MIKNDSEFTGARELTQEEVYYERLEVLLGNVENQINRNNQAISVLEADISLKEKEIAEEKEKNVVRKLWAEYISKYYNKKKKK